MHSGWVDYVWGLLSRVHAVHGMQHAMPIGDGQSHTALAAVHTQQHSKSYAPAALTPTAMYMQVHLGQALLPGNRTALYCSSDGPCLVFATAAGKVLVHNPHEASNSSSSRGQPHLNINKQITALAAGALLPQCPERDVLLIGTPNFLQAYDIHQNRDLFFKDVPDGVSCIVVGRTGSATTPLAIVGGSCSVQGFDSSGQEVFWSVTGGNVTALALADIDEDGQNELLVGCDDADIRVFKDEHLLLQLPEADVVVGLAGLGRRRFAYALRNGTIGAYQGGTRLWRVKSKHSVSCIAAFDLNGDGVLELISGWSNGKVEARSAASGDVVARDSLGSGVAGLLTGQLRDAAAAAAAGQDGSGSGVELELIAASSEGELRGYQTHHAELQAENPGDISMQQQALIDLAQKKQELIYELSSYQQQQQPPQGVVGALGIAAGVGLGAAAAVGAGSLAAGDIASIIPPDTRVDSCIALNKATLSCELTLRTNNATVIKAAIIFGEQVFQVSMVWLAAKATPMCVNASSCWLSVRAHCHLACLLVCVQAAAVLATHACTAAAAAAVAVDAAAG